MTVTEVNLESFLLEPEVSIKSQDFSFGRDFYVDRHKQRKFSIVQ